MILFFHFDRDTLRKIVLFFFWWVICFLFVILYKSIQMRLPYIICKVFSFAASASYRLGNVWGFISIRCKETTLFVYAFTFGSWGLLC